MVRVEEPDCEIAVLIVHGVGETGPGKTVDLLLPALEAQKNSSVTQKGSLQVLHFKDREEDSKIGLFPVHLRRATIQEKHAIFGEVYWADLSEGREGIFNQYLEMFNVIFGLRHISDQALALRKDRLSRWLRCFLWFAAFLLRGPVIAAHAFLVGALVVANMLPEEKTLEKKASWILDIYKPAGALLQVKDRTEPEEQNGWRPINALEFFSFELLGTGSVIACVCLFVWLRMKNNKSFWPTLVGSGALISLFAIGCMLILVTTDFGRQRSMAECYIMVMDGLVAFCAVICSLLFLLSLFLVLAMWRSRPEEQQMQVHMIALGAGVLQFLLLFTALAAFDLAFYPTLTHNVMPHGCRRALPTMPWCYFDWLLAMTFVLCLLSGATFLWRAKKRPESRLIVGYFMLAYLAILCPMLLASLEGWWVRNFLTNSKWWDPTELIPYDGLSKFTSIVFVALFFSLPLWGKSMRVVLHICNDIIKHFNGGHDAINNPFWGKPVFEIRERIQNRFRETLNRLLQGLQENGRLIVIAHSQGSVVAIDGLNKAIDPELRRNIDITLITMGSPFTHLYQWYFPDHYESVDDKSTAEDGKWHGLKKSVKTWINLFRADDYIGTFIACKISEVWLHNIPICKSVRRVDTSIIGCKRSSWHPLLS
jgi:hypothetical protein